jgi:hypothetical protein
MTTFRIPKELEYPVYGMNDLDSTELLQQHYSKQIVNAYPGTSIKPRFGDTEKYHLYGTDGLAQGLPNTTYRSEAIGYEHLGKKYAITWVCGTISGTFRHLIVIHNITDQTTQYMDIGTFSENEIHVSFLKLYKSVYVAIERNYTTNHTNSYRDISKILYIDDTGIWYTREMGINISPEIQSVYVENTEGFGLFGGRSQYGAAVWNNEVWIVAGINSTGSMNTVYHSLDGNLWEQHTITARELMWDEDGSATVDETGEQYYVDSTMPYRYGHRLVVFDEKLWLFGGRNGAEYFQDIWYTSDGETWYCYAVDIGCGARYDFGLVEYDDKLWIIGGFDSTDTALNDVWNSSDGLTWSEVTQVSGFTARGNHTTWVHANKIWIHGGAGTTNIYNTEDGATWTEVAADAGLGTRTGHGIVSYNGSMWCVAGLDTATPQNDVYNSTDGITWTLIQGSADFSARYNFTLLNFLDELYVICGYTGAEWPENLYHSNDGITWTASSTGIESNKYYDYTWTFIRRTDEYAKLDSISNFIYEAWETVNSQLYVGVDEELLTGTVSLSGTALTGVGTLFSTELVVDRYIRIDGVPRSFKIASITDNLNVVVENSTGDTFSAKRYVLIPAVGDPISTDTYRPGEIEGIENINYRRLLYTYATTTYCRVFISVPASSAAQAKGATHVRIYRTLKATTGTVAEGLSHRYLKDIALGGATTFRDATSDDTLAGVTYAIEVTGLYAPPAGRFCFWAGGKLWIGGNPDKKGFWFCSQMPSNTQYPDKYASIFDLENDWVSCDPDDNQRDTAGFEFLGDAYFCKERKIFWLSKASLSNTVTQISYHIGVAFPNSVAFGIDPIDNNPAVYFLSESGPAILKAGGVIRLIQEFKISDLWHWKTGIIKTSAGYATDWHTRNKVSGTFWNSAYWVFYGDSEDTLSSLGTNKVVGCRFTEDGQSHGAFKVEHNRIAGGAEGIFEPQFIIPFDNITAYAISHKTYGGAWQHRIVQFLDPSQYDDSYSEGNAVINTKWETRPLWVGPYRESKGLALHAMIRMLFADSETLTVTITSDDSRHVVPNTFSQVRISGVTTTGHTAYRKTIAFSLKEGVFGSYFTILMDKVIPSTGAVEIFSPELVIAPIDKENEFTSSGGALPAITYIENANTVPEVNAFA